MICVCIWLYNSYHISQSGIWWAISQTSVYLHHTHNICLSVVEQCACLCIISTCYVIVCAHAYYHCVGAHACTAGCARVRCPIHCSIWRRPRIRRCCPKCRPHNICRYARCFFHSIRCRPGYRAITYKVGCCRRQRCIRLALFKRGWSHKYFTRLSWTWPCK